MKMISFCCCYLLGFFCHYLFAFSLFTIFIFFNSICIFLYVIVQCDRKYVLVSSIELLFAWLLSLSLSLPFTYYDYLMMIFLRSLENWFRLNCMTKKMVLQCYCCCYYYCYLTVNTHQNWINNTKIFLKFQWETSLVLSVILNESKIYCVFWFQLFNIHSFAVYS